jgi:hypothetical protein
VRGAHLRVVWFQLLSLIVGSSAISMGIILGHVHGRMCLGSLWLPLLVLGARSIRCASMRNWSWASRCVVC